jgi:hypothetical protein
LYEHELVLLQILIYTSRKFQEDIIVKISNPFKTHQEMLNQLTDSQYPGFTDELEVPMIVLLPSGIHPYNRVEGYFVPGDNLIVMYQSASSFIRKGQVTRFLADCAHELAHWYQHKVLGEKSTGKTNPHRKKSWQTACLHATQNLWPDADPAELTADFFSPYKSARVKGDDGVSRITKVQRDGALSDTQLHHWPDYFFNKYGDPKQLTEMDGAN